MFHNKLKSRSCSWGDAPSQGESIVLCSQLILCHLLGSQKGPSLKQINNHEAQYNGRLTHAFSISYYYSSTLDGKLSVNMDFTWKVTILMEGPVCMCVSVQYFSIFKLIKPSKGPMMGRELVGAGENRNENLAFYPLNQGSPTSRI